MIESSPTFHYWDMIKRYELLVLIFVKAHRKNNFEFYMETLESLIGPPMITVLK